MKTAKILISILIILIFGFGFTSIYAADISVSPSSEVDILTKPLAVSVEDIDLGDYQSEMYIGNTQLLMTTVLPINATYQNITYQSSNIGVATINMMGRITAVAEGEAEISISAGGVTRKFILKVRIEPVITETSQPHIAVGDIEIANFKEEIQVDESVDITVTVLPKDATKPDVTYSSSNSNIATVNSLGQIKGISAGIVTITTEADGFKKSMTLTVKISTQNIQLNETYLVLNVADIFQISAEILPQDADQNITYKSLSPDVVSVSENGLINALKAGSGSIIVSTWDMSKIVNVIVNTKSDENPKSKEDESPIDLDQADAEQTKIAKKIVALPNNGDLTVDGITCRVVSSVVLKALYGTGKTLIVKYPEYIITIWGADIKNIENELSTSLSLSKESYGIKCVVNNGKNLPGIIQIQLLDQKEYCYLFLYNEAKDDYEEINTLKSGNKFSVDFSGKYILTEKALSTVSMNWMLIVIVSVVGIGLGIAYVAVKKKHWFW